MKRLRSAMLLAGVVSLGSVALGPVAAADFVRQSTATLNQRQIRGCMGKHMSTDKSVSYNEAKKICAQQLKAQNRTPPASLASAPPAATPSASLPQTRVTQTPVTQTPATQTPAPGLAAASSGAGK